MHRLQPHRDYLAAEWQALLAAPLSARKAMLVAALLDGMVDRLFAADPEAEDILDFRAATAARSAAVGQIMALCAGQARLVTEAVPVAIEDYGALTVADFMVSLYNDHSVQRLRLVGPDGAARDMLETLAEAMREVSR